jgi:hypothetical protein
MGKTRNAYKILIGNPKAKRPLGREGMIILKWVLKEQGARM